MKDITILKRFKNNGETEEMKEEENMEKVGFFAKHKKGFILGGLGVLAAGAAALIINATKNNPDDDFEEDDFYDDDSDEVSEENPTEE